MSNHMKNVVFFMFLLKAFIKFTKFILLSKVSLITRSTSISSEIELLFERKFAFAERILTALSSFKMFCHKYYDEWELKEEK